MHKKFFTIFYGILVLIGFWYMWQLANRPALPSTEPGQDNANQSVVSSSEAVNTNVSLSPNVNAIPLPVAVPLNQNESAPLEQPLSWPLSSGAERQRLITYGLSISPETSPLPKPERWVGYHTALDLEINPGEEEIDLPVTAACDGEILLAGPVGGYGHVIIQSCTIHKEPVTVLYGHLAGASFNVKKGDPVAAGQTLANLGQAYSSDNGNVRKHLHFALHQGSDIVYRGYVPTQQELQSYIDPLPLLGGE